MMTAIPPRFYCHKIHFMVSLYYHPIYAQFFQVPSFPHVSPPKPYMHLSSPPNVPHATLDFITSIIFGEVERSLSSSLYSLLHYPFYHVHLRPNYLPQHPTPQHPQPMSTIQCERRQSYMPVYPYQHGLQPAQLRKRATN